MSPVGWLKQWEFLRSPRQRCWQVQGLVRTVPGLQTDISMYLYAVEGSILTAHSPIAHYSHPSELHSMPPLSAKYLIFNHPLSGGLGLDLLIGMEHTQSTASTTFSMPFPVGLKWETGILKCWSPTELDGCPWLLFISFSTFVRIVLQVCPYIYHISFRSLTLDVDVAALGECSLSVHGYLG